VALALGMILKKGNSTMGSMAVAGMGMASVIHHVAMRAVTAAQYMAVCDMPCGRGSTQISRNRTGPRIKPTSFVLSNIILSLMRLPELNCSARRGLETAHEKQSAGRHPLVG